jgi:hypothetical protein
MPEGELSAARARIEVVDRRLAALQDLGIDTASLRSQLALARARVDEGGHGDAHAVLDDVAEAARRLASGATARSNDWRGLPRERVIEELRHIVAEGGAGEAVTALREHVDDRLRDFERRLRDQLARELAQVIAARPWAKDLAALDPKGQIAELREAIAAVRAVPAAEGAEVDLDGLRRELTADVQRATGDLHAELHRVRDLAGEARAAEPAVRADLERVRAQLADLAQAREADTARVRALVEQALAEHGGGRPAPANAADDVLRGLVVQAGAIQDRLSERLLGLERSLCGLVDRFAPPHPPLATAITALHVAIEDPPAGSPPQGTGEAESAPREPATATRNAIPAAVHLGDPPSGSDWFFTGDDSGGARGGGQQTEVAAARPAGPAMVAIEHKPRDGQDPNEAKTAAFGVQQESVTSAVHHRHDDRPPGFGVDEALIRRLVEERLAAWRPTPGDDLVVDDADHAAQLVRLLPQALRDPAVRAGLFAAIATEAATQPGVLAELTGLRAFLRRELRLAVDGIRNEMGVGV